ncbi:GIY-YIG nuclease family protein [Paenibacillus sp. MCAF9]|uniref:GIY-YIG nuclease family protein n=1 Tax=Paenibacillus sp. MCAF9 TaxID=3233046 RepID=UPI003F963A66
MFFEERERSEGLIGDFIEQDIKFNTNIYDEPNVLYPTSNYPKDEKFRVRLHKSKEAEKDPDIFEILVPASPETQIYSIPFCTDEQLEVLSSYNNSAGVYVFYGPNDNWGRTPLYIGETNDLWGRIVKHVSGSSHLNNKDKDYSPYKYFRWVEIFALDSKNHRKLLEQTLIAVKNPLHNCYTEDRHSNAKERYVNYMNKHIGLIDEITKFAEQDWDYAALELNSDLEEYYLDKYDIQKVYGRNCPTFFTYRLTHSDTYNDSQWKPTN